MNARKKILIETALVVVLGGGLAVAGGAVAGALPAVPNLSIVPVAPGTPAVPDAAELLGLAPVGDHSPPVGDDSAPKPDDGKDDEEKDHDGFDEDKYYESKDEHDEG